jgi:bifunctional UDP-N-acetylglucosamine pyrophosphorylase/glucosamine-1-phosphate N-acetyltransferase
MLATEHRHADAAASLLTARVADPTGYGRIVRDAQGRVDRIVEQGDADPDELEIDEINPSIYCFRRGFLAPALRRLSPENAQGEYYLTDVVEVLRQAGHLVLGIEADDPTEAVGVNDRAQLAEAEAVLRSRINLGWMRAGVGMTDPSRTYLDTTVVLAPDVQLLPGTILEGRTVVGAGSVVGPETHLVDTIVGEGAVVRQTVAREAEIGDRAIVGPYASLRPGTRLATGAHVGTFVEIKNSEIGEGAKVPHLAYVGDAEIGPRANIGAGTITANYDGKRKHRTKVGADARTGSNTVLVAPVEVGDGAYTGAGAVVTRDVPAGALAKGVPASIEEGWVARREDEVDDGTSAEDH